MILQSDAQRGAVNVASRMPQRSRRWEFEVEESDMPPKPKPSISDSI